MNLKSELKPLGRCVGLRSCRQVRAKIKQAKDAILTEARQRWLVPERLLQLAVNEAEALSWQTRYPHLLFPSLAGEKVAGVAAWAAHQRWVRLANPIHALSA